MDLPDCLSRMTRKMGRSRLRGSRLVIEPLRRLYAARYRSRQDAWQLIDDFDGDLKLRVDRSSYIGSQIYWWGSHEAACLSLLDQILKPGMVFVDVGANQGEFTVFAAKRLTAGKVLAFEPIGPIYHSLRQNVELNKFENVIPFNIGLSDDTGSVDFFMEPSGGSDLPNEGLATMYRARDRSIPVGAALLKVFDHVFEETGLDRLDVVKIDVEGAELSVLRGAVGTIRKYIPRLLLEVNEMTCNYAHYTRADLLAFVARLGYRFFLIGRSGKLSNLSSVDAPAFCNVLCEPVR